MNNAGAESWIREETKVSFKAFPHSFKVFFRFIRTVPVHLKTDELDYLQCSMIDFVLFLGTALNQKMYKNNYLSVHVACN